MKKLLMTAALIGASLAAAGSAEAGQCIGRCLGLCWGDGYHARCDCGHGCGPLGCRLFGRGHCGKCKAGGKCAAAAVAYPAEELTAPDEVPTPAVQP